MSESDKGFFWGLAVGAVGMLFLWVIFARITEATKISMGYLTHKSKTYTVTLYDELRIPGEEEN